MHKYWMVAIAALLAGCAGLADRQQQDAVTVYRLDDAHCIEQGLRYPDSDYVDCRRSLQNARLYRQWKTHQMVQTGVNPANPAAKPVVPAATGFQPLDAQNF